MNTALQAAPDRRTNAIERRADPRSKPGRARPSRLPARRSLAFELPMWHLPHMDEAQATLDVPAPTTEQLTATGPTPSRDVDRPPIGVNRWIAIGSMVTVFITATAFVALGKADAAWWGTFVSTTLLGSLGITLGGSAVIKTAEAIRK